MVQIVRLRPGETVSPDTEHLIVRQNQAGSFNLSGVIDNDPEEFAVIRESYLSEARALDAARSFALSMRIDHIYIMQRT